MNWLDFEGCGFGVMVAIRSDMKNFWKPISPKWL